MNARRHKNKDRAMSMLRSKLYELELEKKKEISKKQEDSKLDSDFGSQIRSYVLQPYRMVKDHRTKSGNWGCGSRDGRGFVAVYSWVFAGAAE